LTRDASVISKKTFSEIGPRIRELERQLGRNTLELKIQKDALDKSRSTKHTLLAQSLKPDSSR